MYVHIGEETVVHSRDIIAILDKKTVNASQDLTHFIEKNKGKVMSLSGNSFKSVIITIDAIYFSPLASGTLKKRSNKLTVQEYL